RTIHSHNCMNRRRAEQILTFVSNLIFRKRSSATGPAFRRLHDHFTINGSPSPGGVAGGIPGKGASSSLRKTRPQAFAPDAPAASRGPAIPGLHKKETGGPPLTSAVLPSPAEVPRRRAAGSPPVP